MEGPKVAVETDSIFKGLNLSAQATSTELGRADSPYLRRVQYGTFIVNIGVRFCSFNTVMAVSLVPSPFLVHA